METLLNASKSPIHTVGIHPNHCQPEDRNRRDEVEGFQRKVDFFCLVAEYCMFPGSQRSKSLSYSRVGLLDKSNDCKFTVRATDRAEMVRCQRLLRVYIFTHPNKLQKLNATSNQNDSPRTCLFRIRPATTELSVLRSCIDGKMHARSVF